MLRALPEGANDWRVLHAPESIAKGTWPLHSIGVVSPKSFYNLQLLTGGISWAEIAAICETIGLVYFYTYFVYMFFMYFSVLNIVTGVFVDSAIQRGNSARSV